MDNDAETAIRRKLETAGEAEVYADFWGSGGLSNASADKDELWVIRKWLQEKEKQRNKKLALLTWITVAIGTALFIFVLYIVSEIAERYALVCEDRSPPCELIYGGLLNAKLVSVRGSDWSWNVFI